MPAFSSFLSSSSRSLIDNHVLGLARSTGWSLAGTEGATEDVAWEASIVGCTCDSVAGETVWRKLNSKEIGEYQREVVVVCDRSCWEAFDGDCDGDGVVSHASGLGSGGGEDPGKCPGMTRISSRATARRLAEFPSSDGGVVWTGTISCGIHARHMSRNTCGM